MSKVSAIGQTAEDIGVNYLNLLLTQLRHQNPLKPMDNSQMTSQLAQVSQLQQLENINSKFANAMAGARLSQASELIGKTVEYMADGKVISGRVESVESNGQEVALVVGDDRISFEAVMTIRD